MRRIIPVLAATLASGACGGRELVRVVPDGRSTGTVTASSDSTFEVVARISGARDPLTVAGADVAYADLERALDEAVVHAVQPRHDSVLTVELVAADAGYRNARLDVSLVVRATLRTRVGNMFVGQTTVVCRDGAIVSPEAGARVVWSCMARIGHDLGGWLADIKPPGEGT
jgi:hypothetical protein|nr:hypothetical protein [Kofleriaceae bacterium]